jgi:nitroreductase
MQTTQTWQYFQHLVASRRSIRDYDGEAIPDGDMQQILQAALLAPSSANAQPYQLHLVKDPAIKARVAKACNNQRAAVSAPYLVVLVSSKKITRRSVDGYVAAIKVSEMDDRTKTYHLDSMKKMRGFLSIGGLPVWSPLMWIARQWLPVLTLFPFSPAGLRHWLARSTIYAAQNLMLAAAAMGYDTCPMEGFNPQQVAKILDLSYGSVVPLVIAVGKRTADARVDPQWRRPLEEVVIVH